jgi:cell wall assembly regulator SMI1
MERTETTKHGVKLTIDEPATDETRVAALERQIGRRLPEDYREFMLRHNGGRPKPDGFEFALRKGADASSAVEWFLSLHDGEHSNLERTIRFMRGRFPPDTMPIASDAFGNKVLLGLDGKIRGKVYFWDHEREPDGDADWSNIDLVADSFDSFMSGLKPTP